MLHQAPGGGSCCEGHTPSPPGVPSRAGRRPALSPGRWMGTLLRPWGFSRASWRGAFCSFQNVRSCRWLRTSPCRHANTQHLVVMGWGMLLRRRGLGPLFTQVPVTLSPGCVQRQRSPGEQAHQGLAFPPRGTTLPSMSHLSLGSSPARRSPTRCLRPADGIAIPQSRGLQKQPV